MQSGMTMIPIENKKKDNLAYDNYHVRTTTAEQFAPDGSPIPIALCDYCRINVSVDSTIFGSDGQKIGELWLSTKTKFLDWDQTKPQPIASSVFHAYGAIAGPTVILSSWVSSSFGAFATGGFLNGASIGEQYYPPSIMDRGLDIKFGKNLGPAVPRTYTGKLLDVTSLENGVYQLCYRALADVTVSTINEAFYSGGGNSGPFCLIDTAASQVAAGNSTGSVITYVDTYTGYGSAASAVNRAQQGMGNYQAWASSTTVGSTGCAFVPIVFQFAINKPPGYNGNLYLGNYFGTTSSSANGGISSYAQVNSDLDGNLIRWDLTISRMATGWSFSGNTFPVSPEFFPLNPPSASSVSLVSRQVDTVASEVQELRDTVKQLTQFLSSSTGFNLNSFRSLRRQKLDSLRADLRVDCTSKDVSLDSCSDTDNLQIAVDGSLIPKPLRRSKSVRLQGDDHCSEEEEFKAYETKLDSKTNVRNLEVKYTGYK